MELVVTALDGLIIARASKEAIDDYIDRMHIKDILRTIMRVEIKSSVVYYSTIMGMREMLVDSLAEKYKEVAGD